MALDLDNKHYSILCSIGEYYEAKTDFEKAEHYFKLSIESNPTFAKLYYNLGKLYYIYLKRYDDAEVFFKKGNRIRF